MHDFLKCLTVLALVAMVGTLLSDICVVLLALGQGVRPMWRIASNAPQRPKAHEAELPLARQGTVLSSTEPAAR